MWLNVKNFTLPLTPKFMAKFAGPFSVVKQVFDDAYKLALPPGDQSASTVPCLVTKRVFQRLGEAGARTSVATCIGTRGKP